MSVLLGIIVGNLFVNCFLYKLQNANNVSSGLYFGRVMLGSVIVAIPVRLLIKTLFKITVSRSGSTMDRVVQIFRVSAFSNDVVPAGANEAQRLDIELLYAFKNMYVAKLNLRRLYLLDKKESSSSTNCCRRSSSNLLSLDSGSMRNFMLQASKSTKETDLAIVNTVERGDVEAPVKSLAQDYEKVCIVELIMFLLV